ncbi:hypothetical protein [Streptomyces sp. SYSU K217416]
MSVNDPFNLDVRVAAPQAVDADPASLGAIVRTTAKLATKVTCKSCTCASCITQCPTMCF